MKLKYKDGHLSIDLFDLLENVPAAEKTEMLKTIACDDQVITDVTAMILNGWTAEGYSGGSNPVAQADTVNCHAPALDKARREIAKRSGEVAKGEIERLEKALTQSEKRRQELEEARFCAQRSDTF